MKRTHRNFTIFSPFVISLFQYTFAYRQGSLIVDGVLELVAEPDVTTPDVISTALQVTTGGIQVSSAVVNDAECKSRFYLNYIKQN